ncbi:MAG: hypothetical protein KF691_15000 [Phycisphaeraceae bacterium]|nr:hypothetical protein [Phycisphaeraceae bacterium]
MNSDRPSRFDSFRSAVAALAFFAGSMLVVHSSNAQVAPVPKVKVKVWLKDLSIIDDMDDRLTRGCGDLVFAWNCGFEGEPSTSNSAGAKAKNSDDKPYNICDNSTLGLNVLLIEKDLCCPIPDLEAVIDFWDDDDSTAEMIADIADNVLAAAVGVILKTDGKPIQDALAGIHKALQLTGKPTSDSMGTMRNLDIHPPGTCIFCDATDTTEPVNLDGGAGKNNGSVTLTWKACQIGTCAPIGCDSGGPPPTPPEDNIEKARGGQSSDDEIDLHMGVGDDVLQIPMLAGQTRDFLFGIDADMNPATGVPPSAPWNALVGCEWRIRIHQTSDGSSNSTTAGVEQYTAGSWHATAMPVLFHAIRGREAVAYVSKSALGLGSAFAVMVELDRNGILRDVEPNNQIAHRYMVQWLAQGSGIGEPPYVVQARQMKDAVAPMAHIRFTFNENVTIGPNPIQIAPPLPLNIVRSWRTMDVYFQTPVTAPSEQMYALTLLPAQITDAAGNQLDGNADGIPGDPYVRKYDPPELRLTFTDNAGNARNEYLPGETVFLKGSGLPANGPARFYFIANGPLSNGQTLVDISPSHTFKVVNVSGGNLLNVQVGVPCDSSASQGGDLCEVDGVLDVNNNGIYDAGTDVFLKGESIGVNAGMYLDQNANATRDKMDILLGDSRDADADGIPDEVPVCRGDLNFDGLVDDADFVKFVQAYNLLLCTDDFMPPHCQSDLNRDGLVDDGDFVVFVHNYDELICP